MKRRKFRLRTETLLLIVLTVVFIFLQVLLQRSDGSAVLGVYKGVLVSLQFGTCLLMMAVSQKRGTKVAITLMSISAIVMILIILRGVTTAVPGLCNSVFYIITIIIISQYEIRKEKESRQDFTTGALNRKGLFAELKEKINDGRAFSIIQVSLNNFKAINDSYGHAYGDDLLRKMARRIESNFGKDSIVARVSGAEFVVIVDGNQNIQATADHLLEVIREKTTLVVDDATVECYIEGFAGASSYPNDATHYESLIKYADIAMTEASTNKSKQAYLFSPEMLDNIERQVVLRHLIKDALLMNSFYLVYQPQFELGRKKLRGFETLLRMNTTTGEAVSPAEFIPVAEKSDLILQIDDYVLERAMLEFRDIVINNPELIVSVNVSAKNFADMEFVSKIKKYLSATGFPGKNLEIEITEYCMVNSMEQTTLNIHALRDIGVQVALDDFGTGYTSLNYVASMPIDLLKIDKSLIDDIENDRKRRDFVRAVITMGQLMECEIISEGVENESQISCLKEDGCDFVQGFVWGRPLMYEDAVKLVKG